MIFECKNVSLIYDEAKEEKTFALKNINLALDKNRFIGILGPSGSGKSSLLYALAGLKNPTSGYIKYNGKDLHGLPQTEKAAMRKKDFGFIFQRNFLIEYLNVLDNVLISINDNSGFYINKAIELLDKFDIKNLAHKFPYALSGGQRQKVSIARALLHNPKVIFADELTSALDQYSALSVMQLLNEYKKNALILVVTHDSSILENADEIIYMRDGAINKIKTEKGEI
ncbi:MAG: ABC transporter ATP-binding protein [Clostridia bacterium]|nr:ABC transporter ATP-binding protein [Clostridia bacterium]